MKNKKIKIITAEGYLAEHFDKEEKRAFYVGLISRLLELYRPKKVGCK